MTLRDAIVTVTILASVPFCLTRPWIGILMWSWISYMNPHRLTWGYAYSFPFAFIVSVATLTGLVFTRDRNPLPRAGEVGLLLLLWLTFFLSTWLAAFYPVDAWHSLDRVSKILLMTFLTIILIRTRERLHMLLLVIALSIGFFGFKGGLFAFATGGQYKVYGPEGSFIAGNNEVGLALNMVLPILWFLRAEEPRRWLRHFLFATFWLSVVAIIATWSRGALLGLAAVLAMLFWKSKGRVWLLLLMIFAGSLAINFMPSEWLDRMGTIATYKEDGSAMGRINAWRLSLRIAADRPILGAGFRPFTKETSMRYMPEEPARETDAHNIFFQILAEHGWGGLLLYAMLVLTVFGSLRNVQARSRRLGGLDWITTYARMTQVSMVGYVVTGFFLSLCYFDLYFHLVAITVILKVLLEAEARARVPAEETEADREEVGLSGAAPQPAGA